MQVILSASIFLFPMLSWRKSVQFISGNLIPKPC